MDILKHIPVYIVPIPIPTSMTYEIIVPFPRESHGIGFPNPILIGNPIPMHISTAREPSDSSTHALPV